MKVFESTEIATLTLPNRLLMAPVKTGFGAADGTVTEQQIAYYRRRAEGGVGAVVVEPCYVDPAGKEHPRQLGLDDDGQIVGLMRLVEAIHAGGARAIVHLNHAGRAANPKASGRPPEAPSERVCPTTGATAQAMGDDRIAEIIQAFGAAARRARQAGFDALELQCGLGYLAAQFLSPRTNRRTDRYGGDASGRERFVRELVQTTLASLDGALPLIVRMSATEQVDGGLGMDDAKRLGALLETWGAAALHVVTGSACDSPPWYYQHMSLPEGRNEALAAQVKGAVGLPVIVAGRLGDPGRIAKLIGEAGADYVALGRPLVADPDLPRKMAEGHPERVLTCGSCLQGCLASVKAGKGLGCIVNPEVGHEAEVEEPAGKKRHVVVVGGGPAGLTAATVAARRGHRVTLFERSELGGQFSLAPLAPGKQAMERPLSALLHQARQTGAELRTGTEATVEQITELAPDAVILAAGASPVRIDVPGLQDASTGNEVLLGHADTGASVLVVGGGLVGIEVAEFLAGQGKSVTVVEMLQEVAQDMEMITRKMTMARLAKLPVTLRTGTVVEEFHDGLATVRAPTGAAKIGPFDTVVLAVGTRPNQELLEPLRGRGMDVHVVGDALELNQIMGAVQSAWRVARSL